MHGHQQGAIDLPSGLLDALRRFNARGGSHTPLFDLRRVRMLRLCSAFMIGIGLPWAFYLFRNQETGPAWLEVYLVVTALAMLYLAQQRLLRQVQPVSYTHLTLPTIYSV